MPKPPDRVQVMKQESAAKGGDAADSDPFLATLPLNPAEDMVDVAGVAFQEDAGGGVPTNDSDVVAYREGGLLYLEDQNNSGAGRKSLDDLGGGGITASQHQALRQLAHFIDDGPACGFASGAFKETLPSGSLFPTSEIWWESAAKLKKIVSLDTTWTGVNITQEVWKVYDTDGSTVLCTVTDAISYSGVVETSRTRTIA